MIKQLARQFLHLNLWPIEKVYRRYVAPLTELKERDATPNDYLVKVDNFSEISENLIDKVFSNVFEAGGYHWKLVVDLISGTGYDYKKDGIWLHLEIAEPSILAKGWEVNAMFNFFIYNQLTHKYVCLKDMVEARFHSIITEFGVEFMDMNTFKNPSKGFLMDDSCIFGVEMFFATPTKRKEYLYSLDQPKITYKFTWKVEDISKKLTGEDDEWYDSDYFTSGDYKWKIWFDPNPNMRKGSHIGVALELNSTTLPPQASVLVNYTLRLKDQTDRQQHCEIQNSETFLSAWPLDNHNSLEKKGYAVECSDFISLTKFKDPTMSYLLNDACILEAEINLLALNTPQSN